MTDQDNTFQDRLKHLQDDENWQYICTAWKMLKKARNTLSPDQVMLALSDVLKPHSTSLKEEFLILFDKLQAKKLLKEDEKNFLLDIFEERLNHIMRTSMVVTCYMISPEGLDYIDSRNALEERIMFLESLFKNNKINSEAYTEAKNNILNIVNTLAKIENKDVSFKLPIKQEYVELIVEMSK